VTLVGLKLHVTLAEDELSAKLTIPEKPSRGVVVIVEVPEPPTLKAILVGLGEIAKSWSVIETVAVSKSDPLVPVTVTV